MFQEIHTTFHNATAEHACNLIIDPYWKFSNWINILIKTQQVQDQNLVASVTYVVSEDCVIFCCIIVTDSGSVVDFSRCGVNIISL